MIFRPPYMSLCFIGLLIFDACFVARAVDDDTVSPPPPQTRIAPYPYPTPTLAPEPLLPETETEDNTVEAPAPASDFLKAVQEEFDQAAAQQGGATGTAPESPDRGFGYYVLRGAFGLCAVCAGILFLGYLVRKYGRKSPLLAGQQLGAVLGRVHLSPRASLHYVRTGGRVLVIGLTQNNITPIAEFDARDFTEAPAASEENPEESAHPGTGSFLKLLKAETESITEAPAISADEELAALRGDLQRLRQYLQEKPGEPKQ